MSDNVGLSTPRGSGTSGFVQRNLAHMRPRDRAAPYPPKERDLLQHRPRQPDRGILEHGRKREVWQKKFTFKQRLLDELDKEEEELNDDEREEIDQKYAEFVKELEDEEEKAAKGSRETGAPKLQFKGHEVHQMADAKEKEMDRMGKAFNIPSNYEEGSHWRRQEERMKKALERDRQDEQDIGRD